MQQLPPPQNTRAEQGRRKNETSKTRHVGGNVCSSRSGDDVDGVIAISIFAWPTLMFVSLFLLLWRGHVNKAVGEAAAPGGRVGERTCCAARLEAVSRDSAVRGHSSDGCLTRGVLREGGRGVGVSRLLNRCCGQCLSLSAGRPVPWHEHATGCLGMSQFACQASTCLWLTCFWCRDCCGQQLNFVVCRSANGIAGPVQAAAEACLIARHRTRTSLPAQVDCS